MDERGLTGRLRDAAAVFRVVRHRPVFTVEEACAALGISAADEAKNLLFVDEKGFFLVVLRGDRKVDALALARERGTARVRLASPGEVKERTGVAVGAVNLFSFAVVLIDEEVLALAELPVHPDDNSVTFFVKTADALRMVPSAVVVSCAKHNV